MKGRGKDSPEVVRFMSLFVRLKDWCDDEPEALPNLAKDDPGLRALCTDVYAAAMELQVSQASLPALYAAPVGADHLAAWRDYEKRYELALAKIELWDAGERSILLSPRILGSNGFRAYAEVTGARANAGLATLIFAATLFVNELDTGLKSWEESAGEQKDEEAATIQNGLATWERLTKTMGFDPAGVFRRHALVPFVLVPRQVAAKHGSAEKISLLRNLEQAHRAFVFGAPYAAIALMRSIMEAVLRDHYAAKGKDLSERIQNVALCLPISANAAALHRLRQLANVILHLDCDRGGGLPKTDDDELEKEIVSLLLVLRTLIEGAK